MSQQNQHLDALQDIRRMMQRSSRFISLSGLSGMAAGFWALVGAWFASREIQSYRSTSGDAGEYRVPPISDGFMQSGISYRLLLLATGVFALSLLSAFYFTWRQAGRNKLPLWDHTAKQLTINTMIPLVAGGFLILTMLQQGEWRFVTPSCLVFYGLALVNGSRYTVSDIRYLGFSEIVLGLISTQFIGLGLYFWAVGFGVLHIIYGFLMWWKYERKQNENA